MAVILGYCLKNIRMIKLFIIKACCLIGNLLDYRRATLDFVYELVTNFLR